MIQALLHEHGSRKPTVATPAPQRLRLTIRGTVQGVGFRPSVYRLATELHLTGWVQNSTTGVVIEVEGSPDMLETFRLRLERELPPHASIERLDATWLAPAGDAAFDIRTSDGNGHKAAAILPDLATCPACLAEIRDPANRRYRYPFTNCTHCGPRFSIIEALPYDRPHTTMRRFTMCAACQTEYDDPRDRRFHAQPNACPICGPQLAYWDARGTVIADRDDALRLTASAIRDGQIVAVKGLGGFHLMADARNDDAVRRLRERKHREEKPFALMYPSLDRIGQTCEVSAAEERLLTSSEAPIVLLRRRTNGITLPPNPTDGIRLLPGSDPPVATSVAPGNPYLGVMLPYTPLHHLLMAELNFPVVATSGNRSDEPICTDEHDALERLGGIADYFLVHNRPIARHMDDSIARIVLGHEMLLRRARGYAPQPISLPAETPPMIAVGGHLKNTIALAVEQQAVLSQHLGDLDTPQADASFRRATADLPNLYDATPRAVACDAHPDYRSTRWAQASGLPVISIQHHYAHVLAGMAEHHLSAPLLGVAWDGTGYGPDGTIWGGEFLLITNDGYERVGWLRPFPLPGGERAIREPWRTAVGLLAETLGETLWDRRDLAPWRCCAEPERTLLRRMLARGINAPRTSSAGRLFDAVASLLDIRQTSRFEGQAAMALEFAADRVNTNAVYPFEIVAGDGVAHATCQPATYDMRHATYVVNWVPMILQILDDLEHRITANVIAATFHNTLSTAITAVAERVGHRQVILTGGCFQNRRLLEDTVQCLRAIGCTPYWPQRLPPNDGGLALGQLLGAWRTLQWREPCASASPARS